MATLLLTSCLLAPARGVAASAPAPARRSAVAAPRSLPPSRRYAALLATADTLQIRVRNGADRYLDSLIAVARQRRDPGLEMVASLNLANRRVYFGGRIEEGVAEVRRWLPAVVASRDTLTWCRALLTLGYADLMRHRNRESAASYGPMLRLARAARLRGMEGYALIGSSYLAIGDGRMAEAERGYRRAAALLQATGDHGAERAARSGLANASLQLGHVDAARSEYEKVLAEARATGDMHNAADALNDLGSIEYQYGDASLAAPYFRGAAVLHGRLGRTGHVLQSLSNVALCYATGGREGEGAALYDSVIAQATAARANAVLAMSLRARGELCRNEGRLADAESYARRAIALRDSGSGNAVWAGATTDLAIVLANQGRTTRALAALEDARRAGMLEQGPSTHAEWCSALATVQMAAGNPAAAGEALREGIALRRGVGGTVEAGNVGDLAQLARAELLLGRRAQALAHFREATDLWESMRSRIADPSWREAFGGVAGRLHGAYAVALLDPAAGRTPEARASDAFAVLQRFRARSLEEALHGKRGGAPRARVTASAFRRGTLRPGELYLDLFVAPDTSVLFALTRDHVMAVGAPAGPRLVPRLRRFRDLSANASTDAATLRAAARALGDELLGPVRGLLRGATTVLWSAGHCDGYPLGLLVPPGEDAPLTVTRRVAIVPSATLLAASRAAAASASRGAGLLALGRDVDERGRRMVGVANESRWLASAFPAAEVRLNDGRRTLAQMLAGLGHREVLHVASHARGSEDAPWRAGFLLGRGDGEEAFLTAPRIASLDHPGRVCVLTGCASAGIAGHSEAMPGLAGAWLASGASAVVASLWSVDDEAAARFAESLYRELARGGSIGRALAAAQQAEDARRGETSSRDWSSFVLFGDPETRVVLPAARTAGRAVR